MQLVPSFVEQRCAVGKGRTSHDREQPGATYPSARGMTTSPVDTNPDGGGMTAENQGRRTPLRGA